MFVSLNYTAFSRLEIEKNVLIVNLDYSFQALFCHAAQHIEIAIGAINK